jgi:glycosidase
MESIEDRIKTQLISLYVQQQAESLWLELMKIISDFKAHHPDANCGEREDIAFDQRDAFLITYADQFKTSGDVPLNSLKDFLDDNLRDVISGVHILSFYPYSSDDGFSVNDYQKVNPEFGSWEEISAIGSNFRLMFDAVINHISRQSEWFQAFMRREKPYDEYFIEVDPTTDLSQVVRPRALPLLTPVHTAAGIRYVWTTFSDDQVDLNYANPTVLFEIIRILLDYVARGAEIIRLDAIAYLWKQIGTSCIHLPQVHAVVRLLRAIFDLAAPRAVMISETNVPQEENVSYFGKPLAGGRRTDEAQMVYQFPLAPLILHTFLAGNSSRLTDWVNQLPPRLPGTTFFNFTASHDGIGISPVKGLLTGDEIQSLVYKTLEHGGQISYGSNPDGSKRPYELNITWFDAINDPFHPDTIMDNSRFLASQVIMLSLAGVPGIYIHSIFGSHNCATCHEKTGRARSINREKFLRDKLDLELSDPNSHKSMVLAGYRHLLKVRSQLPAFHPAAMQRILQLGPDVFAILRLTEQRDMLISLTNVTSKPLHMEINLPGIDLPGHSTWTDILTGEVYSTINLLHCNLSAYQTRWIRLNH